MSRLGQLINRHRHAKWTLADQSVVSGSNFVTGILLARFLGPESFGIFVVLQSILLYFNSFHSVLIFQPMMSAAPQLEEPQRIHYLQGVFALQLLLTIALSSILGIMAVVLYAFGLHIKFGIDIDFVVSLIAFFFAFQLQDWQRRYYFVHEKGGAVFLIDCISYGGQALLLAMAYLAHVLDVNVAFWVMAGTSFVAFVVGFMRDTLRPVFSHARSVLRDGWRIGRDYLVAWQFQWLGTQGVLMFSAGVVGPEAVGSIRAAQNIVGPFNILFQAMENVVPVVAARRYGQRGLPGLRHYLFRITTYGSVLLIPVLVMLVIFAAPIIRMLYGASYAGSAPLVIWQAGYIFMQFYLRQTFFFLRTVAATGAIIRTGAIMSIVAVLVTLAAVKQYHETAVMVALLAGSIAGVAYSLAAAVKITRSAKNEPELVAGQANIVGMGIK